MSASFPNQVDRAIDRILQQSTNRESLVGQPVVIKLGGSCIEFDTANEVMPDAVLSVLEQVIAVRKMGAVPILVHGGGKAINKALDEAGIETLKFPCGMRKTDAATMKIVDRVLSDEINPRLVLELKRLGVDAVGLPGRDFFKAETLECKDAQCAVGDHGFVGDNPDANTRLLKDLIATGKVPVISSTARAKANPDILLNCNADDAAERIAIALKTPSLIYVSDVPGVLKDKSDQASLISEIPSKTISALESSGILQGGMAVKARSAQAALGAGVKEVCFVGAQTEWAVLDALYLERFIGTRII